MALESTPGLGDATAWMTEDEQRLAGMLLENGQAHLFAGWKQGQDLEQKRKFFEQVRPAYRCCAPAAVHRNTHGVHRHGARAFDGGRCCLRAARAPPRR